MDSSCVGHIVSPSLWNSLEIVKLIVSIITPLLVVFITIWFSRVIKRLEKVQWTNQKIIEKRIVVYDSVVPKLNDLLCYFCYIGSWKEENPTNIIKLKRILDKEFHVYAPLFSKELISTYEKFIQLCFETFTGWGNDAKIKSLFVRRKENYPGKWITSWSKCFSDDKLVSKPEEIKTAYTELIRVFQKDLEIFKSDVFAHSQIPTINFK
jgi:hypothetical protein